MSAERERDINEQKQREPTERPQPADRAEPRPARRARPEKTEAKASTKDISPLLKGWDYEPGTINVRKIRGADGLLKLQMRLEKAVKLERYEEAAKLRDEITRRRAGQKVEDHG